MNLSERLDRDSRLHQLRDLGEYSVETRGGAVEEWYCRHQTHIRNYSRAYGAEVKQECPQCAVEMEILERQERMERMLLTLLERSGV